MSNLKKGKTWWNKVWAQKEDGAPPLVKAYVVTAAHTVYRGDMVKFTPGAATIETAESDDIAVLGTALANAAAGASCAVAVATSETRFMMKAKASTALTSYTIGDNYDLVTSGSAASLIHHVDTTQVQGLLRVVGYVDGDDSTDTTTPGRLWVKVVHSQYSGT